MSKKNIIKGFTLVELLGVIIILSLLMIFVFPKIINSIKSTDEKIDQMTLDLIYNASDLFIKENLNNFSKKNGSKYCITLKDLSDSNLLNFPEKDNNKNIINTKTVQVIYNNGFTYELVDNDSCEENILCKSTTSDNKTVGSIPSGDYDYGDEYICNVDGTDSLHFFVIGTEGENVNLILDHNLVDVIYWNSSGKNIQGPSILEDNVLYELKAKTDSWEGLLPPTPYTATGCSKYNYTTYECTATAQYTINYEALELKTRLITAEEIAQIKGVSFEQSIIEELPNWLYINTYTTGDKKTYGYWTATAKITYPTDAWTIIYDASLESRNIKNSPSYFGVRPVITVSKSDLQ